jgi:glycerate dehydrogenase
MIIHVVETIKFGEKQRRRLKRLGEVRYFEGLPSVEELVRRMDGADIVCADWAPIDAAIPKMGPGVKLISVPFTGVGFLPLKEAAARGIRIANSPDFGTESVGEFGVGLMISLVRGIHNYVSGQPAIALAPSLYRKRILILGQGRIGSYVGKVSRALGMKVSFWKRGDSLAAMLPGADVVYCALPLSESTRGLIGESEFGMMKKGSYFVTTSHNQIYNHDALLKALDANLAGAAIDLEGISTGEYKNEVYQRFKSNPKILVTPHVAWKSDYAVSKSYDTLIDNIQSFIEGSPRNLVN